MPTQPPERAKTSTEVFIEAVEDTLAGTPHARHPVQFEEVIGNHGLVACTLCGAVVVDVEPWRDIHRRNHDKHNQVHHEIEEVARRYQSPPTYR
jgi:hypothetical protein